MTANVATRDTFPGANTPGSTRRFLEDINIAFSESSQSLKVYDTDAIANMIENILTTISGERHFEPEFGCDVPALLYEPCDHITSYSIETEIFASLRRWMPYIRVDYANTFVEADPDNYRFNVNIAFQILIGGTRPDKILIRLPHLG